MAEVAALKDDAGEGRGRAARGRQALHDALSVIPNLPREDVPEGKDEHGNVEQRKVGDAAEARRHQQADAALRDRRAARPDGLRDGGQAVRRALRRAEGRAGAHGARARRVHARPAHAPEKDGIGGYTEIAPPILVRDDAMFGTAQLPKFEDDQFRSSNAERRWQRNLDELWQRLAASVAASSMLSKDEADALRRRASTDLERMS